MIDMTCFYMHAYVRLTVAFFCIEVSNSFGISLQIVAMILCWHVAY